MSKDSGQAPFGNGVVDQRRQALGTSAGYSNPGGNQLPVGSVYGNTAVQTPAWGGPNLRWGDTNPGVNAGYANLAMPGVPPSYQQMFSGLAGTPWTSPGGVNQYGRWNWAAQMPPQGASQAGGMAPPAPYQPPAQTPVPQPTAQPQMAGGQPGGSGGSSTAQMGKPNGLFGAMPTATNPYAGGGGNTPYSQAAIDMGMQYGDIWSNPLFANMVAAGGGFGPR